MLQRSALLLVAILCYSGRGIETPEPKTYDVPEAYSVYAAVLGAEHPGNDLVIADTTVPFNQCTDPQPDDKVNAAIKSYRTANQQSWRLQGLKPPYKLISQQEINKLRQRDPKGGFAWRYSGGIEVAHVSAVGFSPDGTIAFMEMDLQCGGLCGSGGPHILKKQKGKWSKYEPPFLKNADGSLSSAVYCSWNY